MMEDPPQRSTAMALAVQYIAVTNNGGYVMSFTIETFNDVHCGGSGDYPVGNSRALDVGACGFAEGHEVWPHMYIVAGGHAVPTEHVVFARNGQTATYTATGTTFSPKIHLGQLAQDLDVQPELVGEPSPGTSR
jgi:hypothetical protein